MTTGYDFDVFCYYIMTVQRVTAGYEAERMLSNHCVSCYVKYDEPLDV